MRTVIYKGRKVLLEAPIREIKGNKEYKVYVINPQTGKVNVVRFGHSRMRLNQQFRKRRRSYCARSGGIKSNKPMKLQPNYWSRRRWRC